MQTHTGCCIIEELEVQMLYSIKKNHLRTTFNIQLHSNDRVMSKVKRSLCTYFDFYDGKFLSIKYYSYNTFVLGNSSY